MCARPRRHSFLKFLFDSHIRLRALSLLEKRKLSDTHGVYFLSLQEENHTYFCALHNFIPSSVPLSIVVGMLQILSYSKSFKYLYDRKCLP
jgi:hypothetical protein